MLKFIYLRLQDVQERYGKWSKAQQYNQKLKDYAETKDAITVLDVAERFGLDYQDYLASDGLHLNQNAYEVYNEMIFDAVELKSK